MTFCGNCHYQMFGMMPPPPHAPHGLAPPPNVPPTLFRCPPPASRPQARVCLAHLTGTCRFGKKCRHRHDVSPAEDAQLRAIFANTPCKHGLECKSELCLFRHDAPLTSHSPYALPQP